MKKGALVFCSFVLLTSVAHAQDLEPIGTANAPSGNIAKQAIESSHSQYTPSTVVIVPNAGQAANGVNNIAPPTVPVVPAMQPPAVMPTGANLGVPPVPPAAPNPNTPSPPYPVAPVTPITNSGAKVPVPYPQPTGAPQAAPGVGPSY